MRTHPYSVYIFQYPSPGNDEGHWYKPYQAFSQDDAIYLANLIHKDSKAVIKVVRYGNTLASFPEKETVEGLERYIARRWPHNQLFNKPRG